MNKKQTICLDMIVKDESHVIAKTLQNLTDNINFDYWVICDTGSTDGTQDIIKDFFKKKNIKGELHQHVWEDFGTNRTKALEACYNKTDYLLIFDADDVIHGKLILPQKLVNDRYLLKFGKGFTYNRPLLVNNRKKWKFVGVLHEYLEQCEDVGPSQVVEGSYYIESGRTGNRSKNKNKYLDDAKILEKAYYDIKDTNDGLANRYVFYCAQSYKDANKIDESIEWYEKCLTLNNWNQEKYHSCLMLGNLYKKKDDMLTATKYWIKSSEYDNERIEGIVIACEYYQINGYHILVNALYHKYKNYKKKLYNKLFVIQEYYNDMLEYYNSISSYYTDDKKSGYESCKKIIMNQEIEIKKLNVTLNNLLVYKDFLDEERNTLDLFYQMDLSINKLDKAGINISENHIKLWDILFEKNRKSLTLYQKKSFNTKKNPIILLSFTTCKRFDLFEQTLNSILNHWLDIKMVDYWFCVDDNSSQIERKKMQSKYKWINYYMKNENEKGHRQSMNIIWNKLNELKPKYWIHLEDDFLFHRKMNYITDAIDILNKGRENNIKQVVFNRCYGETIESYNIKSHMEVNDIVMHNHQIGKFKYYNCHYWKHYSLLPSLVDTEAILKIGNYDSPNTFFEGDYAAKWYDMGYRTAFFNMISCRHIGRLISEINDPTKKNAYQLNEEVQYNKQKKIETKYKNEELESIKNNFIFIKQKDQIGYDISCDKNISLIQMMQYAINNPKCVGFNTLGFFKNRIEKLESSSYFKEEDGIYIKKDCYNSMMK